MARKRMEYVASIAVPPGDTLKEILEDNNMTQAELATRTGLSKKHINEIIKGKSPISQETSLKLEHVLGLPASFWNNLEANYRETLVRVEALEKIDREKDIAREIPYAEIARLGWVIPTRKIEEKVLNLRDFFGVASLELISNITNTNCAYRISESYEASDYSLAAWLRKGKIEATKIKTEKFNKEKLESLIPEFRRLTLEDTEIFYPKMVELCASCGIALILVPHLQKTYVHGATNWANKEKAIIQLSVRGKRADIFWFTFFHEIAHIILHDDKKLHLQNIDRSDDLCEHEADIQARNWLIPPEKYDEFVEKELYFREANILFFAEEMGIHPSIVVGRLCKDKKISFSKYSYLRPSFEIVSG